MRVLHVLSHLLSRDPWRARGDHTADLHQHRGARRREPGVLPEPKHPAQGCPEGRGRGVPVPADRRDRFLHPVDGKRSRCSSACSHGRTSCTTTSPGRWPTLLHFASRVRVPTVTTYPRGHRPPAHTRPDLPPPYDAGSSVRVDRIVCTSPNYLATSKVLRRFDDVDVVPIGLDEDAYPTVTESLPRSYRGTIRDRLLSLHRRTALLQMPPYPARGHAGCPLPRADRRCGTPGA